jgi:subtilisin-like proprotein convertase family protein
MSAARSLILSLALGAWCVTGSAVAASVSWQGWTFDAQVSGLSDGLSLNNVKFLGRGLIYRLSMPTIRVFYENNACGPYADRLGGTLSPIPWAGNATLAQRQFTGSDGQLWYEIGIRDQIGSYDIYQVYYLSANGVIDAHVYSKGLQCNVNHIHYPNWRIDFDLDGPAGDQILRNTGAGFTVLPNEFDLNAASAPNHAWRVRDSTSGLYVDLLPGFPDFTIPDGSSNVPVVAYDHSTVFGRRYQSAEDTGWTYGPNTQVPGNNGESINGADLVLWYEGYLPHTAAEGSVLWHSTGLRLTSSLASAPPAGSTRTFANAAAITLRDAATAATYPAVINVSGMSGTISKVTATLSGLSHTYPDDLDIALVGPAGQSLKLMSDVGGAGDLNGVSLTFDTSAGAMPDNTQLTSGSYRPTDYETTDNFPAPAPAIAAGSGLAVFNGLTANGTWKLYIVDDEAQDSGALSGGWKLSITTN